MSDQQLTAARDAPLGGQAVLEGVMMRGVRTWAVAVRAPAPELHAPEPDVRATAPELRATAPEVGVAARGAGMPASDMDVPSPDAGISAPEGGALDPRDNAAPPPHGDADPAPLGPIEVSTFSIEPPSTAKRRLYRLPVIRGVAALVQSLGIGLRALSISANAQLPEADQEISGGVWAGTVLFSLVFAIGLFFVVPVGITSLVKDQLGSSVLFWVVEGVLRTAIFLGYLTLLSRLPDLRRVFEYHGAEHKVISCYEANDELTPERAARYSRLHPRCGTSFLLIVMIMAIFVFAPVGLPAWWILVLTRILGVPVIAGLSFEVIKWAGRNRRRRWVQMIMFPGLQLQKLTTREPDLDQLAVSIAALQAVLAVETPGDLSAEDMLGVEVVA